MVHLTAPSKRMENTGERVRRSMKPILATALVVAADLGLVNHRQQSALGIDRFVADYHKAAAAEIPRLRVSPLVSDIPFLFEPSTAGTARQPYPERLDRPNPGEARARPSWFSRRR